MSRDTFLRLLACAAGIAFMLICARGCQGPSVHQGSQGPAGSCQPGDLWEQIMPDGRITLYACEQAVDGKVRLK